MATLESSVKLKKLLFIRVWVLLKIILVEAERYKNFNTSYFLFKNRFKVRLSSL